MTRRSSSTPRQRPALAGQATVALARHQFADGLALARRAHRLAPGGRRSVPGARRRPDRDRPLRRGRADARADGGAEAEPRRLLADLVLPRAATATSTAPPQALRLAVSAGAGTVEGAAYVRSCSATSRRCAGATAPPARLPRGAGASIPSTAAPSPGWRCSRAGRGELGRRSRAARAGRQPAVARCAGRARRGRAGGRPRGAARRHYDGRSRSSDGCSRGRGNRRRRHSERGRPRRPGARSSAGPDGLARAPSVSSADAYSWALYRDGRIAAASRLSAEAMRLGSRDPEFLFHAGMIAAAIGDRDRAQAVARAAARTEHRASTRWRLPVRRPP